ncbi:MAG: sensor of blue-light using family protein [Variovorax sp.]|nr:sensor of blue-light using family protein [Variovorax sp.]
MSVLHEFLYCSTLAADQPIGVIPHILGAARIRNAKQGVTGVLVFDGQHFCQHFEGPRATVIKLMEIIARDTRHTQVEVLHQAPLAKRRYRHFSMGYSASEEAEEIPAIARLDGGLAVARFLELLPRFDVAR